MLFSELLNILAVEASTDEVEDFTINNLRLDSRKVEEGDIFFAVKGLESNGEDYISQAYGNGAKAVFVSSKFKGNTDANNLIVLEGIKEILSMAAEMFYKELPQKISAITGTNGKTSIVGFCRNICNTVAASSASIGTIGVVIDDGANQIKLENNSLTTSDIFSNYQMLESLKKDHKVDHVFVEASSHGLHQNRFGDLLMKSAGFINLSQDHLDYHKNFESYFKAKLKLFENHCNPLSIACLNSDIAEFFDLKKLCQDKMIKILAFGKEADFLKISSVTPTALGLEIELEIAGQKYKISPNLIGEFNVYNLACAICLCVSNLDALHHPDLIEKIVKASENVSPEKGRMQIIEVNKDQNTKAVIDYAHTPDALEKAITSLKPHTEGRIITVFGCGGDRDKSKRPLMGKVASDNSDIVIVTDDNPRTENSENIRKDIIKASKGAVEIADRKKAITYGLKQLGNGDTLLVAGKGHEDYQIIGKKKIFFDDSEIVNDFLNNS